MDRNTKGQFYKGCTNHSQILPQVGQSFGELTTHSEEVKRTPDNRPMWLMRCSCGGEQWITARNLRRAKSPRTKCSKCSRREAGVKRMANPSCWKKAGKHSGVGDLTLTHVCSIKAGAVKRSLEWDLSAQYLWDLLVAQEHKCSLSGLPIVLGALVDSKVDPSVKTASLDRVDSSLGYVVGNVQWVHKHVNIMKNSYDQEYFIELCTKIAIQGNHEPSLSGDTLEGATTSGRG